MHQQQRSELVSRYLAGYDEVMSALQDFPEELMTAHPLPDKWSAREIVHHLADSECTSAIRLRRLLAEDRPVIMGYDQDGYARRFKYNERDIAPALEAFRSARATTAQIFDLMTEADWNREGEHTESGRYSVDDWLTIYAAHAHNHASQIRRLREALRLST